MKFDIWITDEELNEMGMDEDDLKSHIMETLDADTKELVGYDVNIINE